MNTVVIDGIELHYPQSRKGDDVAFYLSEDSLSDWFAAKITLMTTPTRAHLTIFEPNGNTIRKGVDVASDERIKYRWLPIEAAHQLEKETAP